MLNNIYEFQKIHLHTQRIMYFLPLVFIYFFLLPNHYQLLVNADESILIKIFDSAQEFLILIEIWFQYLGFRWILSPELKEISYCNMRIKKNRYGVILVTADKYKGLIPTGHAGIIWTSSTIVESLSNGVTTGPNDWNTSKTSCYGISVKGTTVDEDNEASNWCYRQLGKPYNYNYFNVSTRKKFYCSQLVWAAFKDNYGIDLDTSDFGDAVHPMELVNSSKTYTIYKK